ncbi:MAG: Gfo/Idh/MocA family oxidoreductase, partial [Phycisphaeraceae bacterium]|nr:Gfo/Idh/MocA family oxidoreductase [Phycisphaeraceae bacterium]
AGDRPLKVGLIGCGGRGTGAAWQALNADTGVTLHAMADMFPDRLASCLKGLEAQAAELRTQDPTKNLSDRIAVPPERRFTGFDGYKRLLECGCDVVLLCAYPHFRPAHLEAAVAAGCHVFCEKPMAVDAPGLRRVRAAAEAARARGLTLVSGFCWRYADAERATYERIHAGAIGDLVTIHTTYHTSTLSPRPRRPDWSDMEFQLRNWWHFTWLSGDHIVEQACHSIDKICWAMRNAPPVRCVALGGRAARQGAESGHVFDHFAVVYEYWGGGRAFHTTRQIDHCPNDNSDYVYGTSGSAEINGWKPVHEIRDRSGKVTWRYDGQRRDMYQNEHDELFRSVRAGQARNDGDFMCTSTMMSIMGRMAAYTGQTIAWDQAWKSEEDLTPAAYAMGPLAVPPVAVPGVTKFR